MTNTIKGRLEDIRERIIQAEQHYRRTPGSVTLIAISKTRPATDVAQAAQAKQQHFGENYLQDALPKVTALANMNICWHFTGPVQSNKTTQIAQHFSWVHTIDRIKTAQRLNKQRPPQLPPLNICLQYNVSGESSKSGCSLSQLETLAAAINAMPNLKLRGLMALPAQSSDEAQQRSAFAAVAAAQQQLINSGYALDTLSMGMSADFEAAIAAGSTMVRVGTAIFGTRAIRN
ncbi:MAG: YggS family pyridoxal phosphate-dependent enzyme [Gammaproteobacteria bacterium]|nr:YggS family pyridoxal phosphate-dependent enzyme [Gammaproteobacteria bacterium]